MRLALLAAGLTVAVSVGAAAAQDAAPPDVERYLARLALAGPDGPADAAQLVAQAWPALPDSVRRALGGRPDRLAGGAGHALVAWWHAQDPLPATPENEAVAEHLRRVAEAEGRFASDGPAGFDARGEVLVMLGEPARVETLRSRTLDQSFRTFRVPDNELWTYGSNVPVYLFYEHRRGRGWRRGGPMDLLPAEMRFGGGRFLGPLYDFLLQLAPVEPSYEHALDVVETMIYTGVPLAYGGRRAHPQMVKALLLADVDRGHHGAVVRRDAAAEPTGPALPAFPALPLAVRVARFRDASGGLRVEVAYASEPGALVGLRGPHAARSAAVLTEVSRPAALPFPRTARATTVPPSAVLSGTPTLAETATLVGFGRDQHVAVQLDVVDVGGTVVRRAVRRVGPLAPLAAGRGGLVVSDPLPYLVPEGAERALGSSPRGAAERTREGARYPYGAVAPGATIGVYVEAYDLAVRGGRSRYEVERTVHRVRDGERSLVSLSATESGTSFPTAREFIVLPVPDDVRPGDTVELSGTIRDLVTGRAGTWSLAFGVAR